MLSQRPHGVEELTACSRLETAGLRRECIERVDEPLYLPHLLMNACVDAFGEDVAALRCFNATGQAETPPMQDITACSAAFTDEVDRLACIKRFGSLSWNPGPLVEACKTHLPENALLCMHSTASGQRTEPDPDIVGACVEAMGTKGEVALECTKMMRNRPEDPAGSVRACTSMFEKTGERLKCVELARRDPDPERIGACASEEKAGKRFRCVEGD